MCESDQVIIGGGECFFEKLLELDLESDRLIVSKARLLCVQYAQEQYRYALAHKGEVLELDGRDTSLLESRKWVAALLGSKEDKWGIMALIIELHASDFLRYDDEDFQNVGQKLLRLSQLVR
ncbi:hypothetical protein M1563_02230 [Patescibacteria group bacterium]|nr:hypothetical protein [Patescibacteria group bacterium]MCL5409630.1 hypothetical protein [Patescibacteria group bacterium]